MPLDLVVVRLLHRGRCVHRRKGISGWLCWQTRCVVTDDEGRFPLEPDQRIHFPRAPGTGVTGIRNQTEVFAPAMGR